MQIPRFWARREFTFVDADGDRWTRSALGWSSDSAEHAQRMAEERAKLFAQLEADGRSPEDETDGPIYYTAMPLHEPLLETLDVDGMQAGLITRNRYGCRVLNTDRVMFADIDFDLNPRVRVGLLQRLLGRRPTPPASPASEQERSALDRVRAFVARTGHALRAYRTFNGLRLLFVGEQFAPNQRAVDLLKELRCDPLYVQLTRRQDCFRARLTPKPWRIGLASPPHPSPTDHPDYPKLIAAWAEGYEQKAAAFATCRLVEAIGTPADDAVLRAVVAVHDRHVLSESNRPLA